MNTKSVKAIARDWIKREMSGLDDFGGAFFHGSINWMPDDTIFPATSDVDLMVLFDDPPAIKLGKFVYRGVLLEVSYLAMAEVRSAEHLLGQYHLASSFRINSIIADPMGRLAPLQATIARNFAKREWVTKRCEQARDKVLGNLATLDASAPFHMQVMSWLFTTGVMTHVLLVADLQNPTVRTRYVAVRALLERIDRLDVHEALLQLQGSAQMSQTQVEQHLTTLTEVFDAAKEVIKTPIFFASDISDASRPIAIDGSRDLIERGLHREAVFWIVATYARCMHIFHVDAPELEKKFEAGFRDLVGDLGIRSFEDICARRDEIEAYMPRLWVVAEGIVDVRPRLFNSYE